MSDESAEVGAWRTGLREWLAAHHGTTADRVLITNGSLEGYVFLLETFLSPGDLIALEAPTYDRALLQAQIYLLADQPF